jgi:tRNA threonylcarbamoyladenosine biosynthesis protein TsaB
MKLLALETSGTAGSVAVLSDGNLLAQSSLAPGSGSAQSLAPAIASILQTVGWRPTDVRLVAVTQGPGSFTGLRVGVTTAKAFAYAVGAEVLGIDTLAVIAHQAPGEVQRVSVAIDAQRGDVVTAVYVRDASGWLAPQAPACLLSVDHWLAGLAPDTPISGPVLRKLVGRLPSGVAVLDESFWQPQASTVGRLAARDYAAGRRNDLWSFAPFYSRRSAAEERWEGRAAPYGPVKQ